MSKGNECQIRLLDPNSGELYAQAPINADQPSPVEAVIDSSRFFVLRIEDMVAKSGRYAFIGLGFRERSEAYDFQAALYDHVKYINKKKEAAEMEHEYQSKPQVDYSLKEGETIRLDMKPVSLSSATTGPAACRIDLRGLFNYSLWTCFAFLAVRRAWLQSRLAA